MPKKRRTNQRSSVRTPGEHYGIPARPYVHGEARTVLLECPDCGYFMPVVHPCPPVPDETNETEGGEKQ